MFAPEKIVDVAKAVLTIHRDFGDRTDRKHARLKYVVAERGVDFMRAEIEKRANIKLEPAKPYKFTTTADLLGWHQAVDGKWFLTLFVETGRVKDVEGRKLKAALREVAEKLPHLEFRLTTNQNVILANACHEEKVAVTALLATHGVKTENQTSVLHAASMACPALPTCGLALAESERMLPGLIDRIEKLCGDLGLGGEEIIIRSTGCPNGCARPYMAEIAFVGKAPGRYQVWLGGDISGTRLNRVWSDVVKDPDIESELRPVLARFAKERNSGERFGDWCDRVLLNEQPKRQLNATCISMTRNKFPKPMPSCVPNRRSKLSSWAIAQAKGRAIVSTNFRPYEAVILHLATQVQAGHSGALG